MAIDSNGISTASRTLTVSIRLALMCGCAALGWVDQGAAQQQPAAQAGDTEPAPADEEEPEGQKRTDYPKLSELKTPTAEDLLHGERLDWVVLQGDDERVIITVPITPRPDTLNKMQKAIDEKLKQRKDLKGEELNKYREELEQLSYISIQMPKQYDETQYELDMKHVAQVIHHEDLMLRRIDILIGEQNFELGYELLNVLRRSTPNWPGAAQRHNQFLLAEANRRIARGDLEPGLTTLREVHQRNPTFRGLSESVGLVINRLFQNAVKEQDWRQARHYLNRLSEMYAEHSLIEPLSSDLATRADQALRRADQARSQGDYELAARSAEEATRIWPRTRNLRTKYRLHADRYQTLHVGVLELPSETAGDPAIATRADRREARLRTVTFFHMDHAEDGSAHYSSRFCDRWEPLNLGREAVFELRSSRQPWELQPIVTAPAVAARLGERLNPLSPEYDERFAGYASSVEVTSPFSLKIQFRRVPVRTEALLNVIVEPQADVDAVSDETQESPVSLRAPLPVAGGFDLVERTETRAVYRRSIPEPEGQRLYRLAEVQEHRYGNFNEAVQALLRGDVSVLPDLPARHVERLRSDDELLKDLFVEKTALPVTHIVQLNPASRLLRNRELRRALMYAIDRQSVLAETVLEGAPRSLGRIVTGPFPSESYANSALAVARKYDPVSAVSLALAARQQLGGSLPVLRMAVVDEPIAQAAARRLVETWKRFGIDVTAVPLPSTLATGEGADPEWDLLYRTLQMAEPVVDLWPFLTLSSRARVSDLDEFPDWLRQEIVNLDLIGDWSNAVQATKRLHRHLWSEVMVIPLWEVDQYLVYRKNIRNVPVSPVHAYDEIDRWVVEAWYPTEEP